jgi:hypothetical protein
MTYDLIASWIGGIPWITETEKGTGPMQYGNCIGRKAFQPSARYASCIWKIF